MTEDQLKLEPQGWLAETGYNSSYDSNIAVDGSTHERSNYIHNQLEEYAV
jgi:hypothetical protein